MSASHLRLGSTGLYCKFLSLEDVDDLFGISYPYQSCVGHAPRGKNRPHCSNRVNKRRAGETEILVESLFRSKIPSQQADDHLRALASHVLCGINAGHQGQADVVYEKLCNRLWQDFLFAQGLRLEPCGAAPRKFTSDAWMACLRAIRRQNREHLSSLNQSQPRRLSEKTTPQKISRHSRLALDDNSHGCSSCQHERISTVAPRLQTPIEPARHVSPRHRQERSISVRRDEVSATTIAKSRNSSPPSGHRRPLSDKDSNTKLSRSGDRMMTSSRRSTELDNSARKTPSGLSPLNQRLPSSRSMLLKRWTVPSPIVEIIEISDEEEVEEARSGPSIAYEGWDESQPALLDENPRQLDATESEEEDLDYFVDSSTHARAVSPDTQAAYPDFEDDFVNLVNPIELSFDLLSSGSSQADPDSSKSNSTDLLAHFERITLRDRLKVYPQAPSALSQLKQLLNAITQTISPNFRYEGFIYAFARPSEPGMLKIGSVKTPPYEPLMKQGDPVADRLAKWQADCGEEIVEVFRVSIPCLGVRRIESLIHHTLRKYRKIEDPPCPKCEERKRLTLKGKRSGGRHQEWFEVEEGLAREVVSLWALFSEQPVYDTFGKLVDFWSAKIDEDRKTVKHGDTALGWLRKMGGMVEEQTLRWFHDLPYRQR